MTDIHYLIEHADIGKLQKKDATELQTYALEVLSDHKLTDKAKAYLLESHAMITLKDWQMQLEDGNELCNVIQGTIDGLTRRTICT